MWSIRPRDDPQLLPPAGTCPIGAVVDGRGAVLGVERLHIADASIMPTIPRASTNLTTAAIAERIAETV